MIAYVSHDAGAKSMRQVDGSMLKTQQSQLELGTDRREPMHIINTAII